MEAKAIGKLDVFAVAGLATTPFWSSATLPDSKSLVSLQLGQMMRLPSPSG